MDLHLRMFTDNHNDDVNEIYQDYNVADYTAEIVQTLHHRGELDMLINIHIIPLLVMVKEMQPSQLDKYGKLFDNNRTDKHRLPRVLKMQ